MEIPEALRVTPLVPLVSDEVGRDSGPSLMLAQSQENRVIPIALGAVILILAHLDREYLTSPIGVPALPLMSGIEAWDKAFSRMGTPTF